MAARKIILRSLAGTAGLALILGAGLATPPGHWLVASAVGSLASSGAMKVSVSGISGWPPFNFSAAKITVADGKGTAVEIDGLGIDLHVGALLTGRLVIDELLAQRIAIDHLPDTGQPAAGGSGGGLPPPIARLAIERLDLGPALAGRAATLNLTGVVAAGASGIEASFAAERRDGATGRLTATASRSADGRMLAADISGEEGANGILAGLMGRAEAPAYRVSAKVGGDDGRLDGTLTLTSDRDARFSGRVAISPDAGTARRVTLAGDGDLTALLPAGWADLIGGPLKLALDARWRDDNGTARIDIAEARASSGALTASASGTYGGAATNLTLGVNAAAANGAPLRLPPALGGGSFARISVNGTAAPKGSVTRIDLAGTLAGATFADTTIPSATLSFAAEGRPDLVAGATLPFAFKLEASAIDIGASRITADSARPIAIEGDGKFDGSAGNAEVNAIARIGGGEARFAGTLGAASGRGKLTLDIPDLARLAALARRPLAGSLKATSDGDLYGSAGTRIVLAATATDLEAGTLKGLLTGQTRLGATLTRTTAGRFDIDGLAIDGSTLSAKGNLSLAATSIAGTITGRLATLAPLAPNSSGAASFDAKISGETARPALDATIAIASGRLLDRPIESGRVTIKGAPSGEGWQGTIDLGGRYAGAPLTGRAEAMLSRDGQPSMPRLDFSIGGNRISGAVAAAGGNLLSGTITVDAPDLRTLAAFALAEASGNGRATLRLQPEGGRQSVAVTVTGRDVVSGASRVARIDGDVSIDDAFGTPRARGRIEAAGLVAGGQRVDGINVTATAEGGATRIEASAKGSDFDLSAAGRLTGTAGGNQFELQRFAGTAFGQPVKLARTATIRTGAETVLSVVELGLGGGTVTAEGIAAPRLDLQVTLRNLPAAAANRFSPGLGAEGTVSGTAKITGTSARPLAAWTVDWSGMRLAQTRASGLPALQITLAGSATAESTTVDGKLAGGGLSLDLAGRLPFTGGALDLRARGNAPLALAAFSIGQEVRLGGTARLDIAVAGTAAAPQASGTIDLVDAVLADPRTGFGMSGGSGRIRLDGKTARIERVAAKLTQGGEMTLAGTISIDPAAGLPADLTLKISNGRYSDGTTVNAGFAADLKITGPLAGNGLVAGRVDLARTEILLPDKMGGSSTAISVTHRNAAAGFKPPLPRKTGKDAAGGSGGGLRLDLDVNNTSAILVRGFGLDAELGGSIKVGGTTSAPQTIGAFTLRRGRMEVIGKRFQFTSGTLTFSGSPTPTVDFVATTQTSSATVTLNVTGPASDPVIKFSSSPELPQEEVLSQLLLDRSVGSLSPVQAAQLVDAAAQLTGALERGNGIFDRIRKTTGLDDLDVRQNKTGGTTVGVGRRINDRTRLGVEQDTSTGQGRVSVDIDINKNLKARGETGQDGSGKVGLTYEKEY